jgi:cytoskeletal protein RodZ
MFQFIERIRQKPQRERQLIALSVAGGIAGIIFILWAISFVALLGRTPAPQHSFESAQNFTASFEEATKVLQESFNAMQQQVKSLDSQTTSSETESVDTTTTAPETLQ